MNRPVSFVPRMGASRAALLAGCLVACTLLPPRPASAVDYRWVNPSGGSWSAVGSWSPAGYPYSQADSAHVPATGEHYSILLDCAPNLRGFFLENSAASLRLRGFSFAATSGLRNAGSVLADAGMTSTLYGVFANQSGGAGTIEEGATLQMAGAWVNDGLVRVHDGGSRPAYLSVIAHSSVTGSGSIRFGGQDLAVLASPFGYVFTNAAGHTLRGAGVLQAPIVNHGAIIADVPGSVLRLNGSNKISSGTLAASTGGRLVVDGIVVDQTNGHLAADGGEVELLNAWLVGGTLSTTGASAVTVVPGTSTTSDVRSEGNLRVVGGGVLRLAGSTFTNSGTTSVFAGGTTPAQVQVVNHVTASGGGTMVFGDSSLASLTSPFGYVFTNAAGHTLRGAGVLQAPIANLGAITADVPGSVLRLNGNNKINSGAMTATAGSRLVLDAIGIDNTGGRIAADGGEVELLNAALVGGTFSTTGSSAVTVVPGTSTTSDVRSEGSLRVVGGGVLRLAGSTFTNSGTTSVFAGGTTPAQVQVVNHVTASGGGTMVFGDSSLASLTSPFGYVFTNAAGHTLRGAGVLQAPIANLGAITADVPGSVLRLNGNNKINSGALTATAGSRLVLDAIGIDNTGGRITADGAEVELLNSWIQNGVLATNGTGTITILPGSSWVAGVRNEGEVCVATGGVLQLAGSGITNAGTIRVHTGGSGFAQLQIVSNVTVGGEGSIVLADSSLAVLSSPLGYSIVNATSHTLRGAGEIQPPLYNYGTVRADVQDRSLRLNGWGKVNYGTFEADAGGELRLEVAPNNYHAGLHQLTGGIWRAGEGSTIRFPGCPIDTNAANIVLEGASSRLLRDASSVSSLEGFVRNAVGGSFAIRAGRDLDVPGSFSNSGLLVVGRSSEFRVGAVTTGDYVQTSTGFFRSEIGGREEGEYGRLIASGVVSVSGGLDAKLVDGFVPAEGDTFVVMTFAARTGDFTAYGTFRIGGGLYFVPEWRVHSLVLRVATEATLDAPPASPAGPTALSFTAHGGSLVLALPEAADVEITVFDAAGRRVATPARGLAPAGRNEYAACGRAGARDALAPGLYLARARVAFAGARHVLSTKLLVLR